MASQRIRTDLGPQTDHIASSLRRLTEKRSRDISRLLEELDHTLAKPDNDSKTRQIVEALERLVSEEYRFLQHLNAELDRLPSAA